MPELPEVQTVVSELNKKILNKKIIDVWSDWPKMIKTSNLAEFKKKIKGLKIKTVKRRGKNILIYLEAMPLSVIPAIRQLAEGIQDLNLLDCRLRGNDKALNMVTKKFLLLIHLKMTGHLLLGQWRIEKSGAVVIPNDGEGSKSLLTEKVNGYVHLIFYLDDGSMIGFSDMRKFGKILLGTEKEIEALGNLDKLVPEPLAQDFDLKKFKGLIKGERRKIKQVLLDQEVMVGFGNIYSDETLWASEVHPCRLANEIKEVELNKMYVNMRAIFLEAIRLKGTSIVDFRHPSGQSGFYSKVLKVYQREGEPCYRCRTLIERIKIATRSAHFCPQCQK
jgi:formamidopyrimidine-DNA glycosylase